ncbi:MAG TPA: hypothetical protein VMJ93_05965 [Verrucomicrobiae bacterium]|nr:hypothetical protein [Verrucomicrobiae bacterium]
MKGRAVEHSSNRNRALYKFFSLCAVTAFLSSSALAEVESRAACHINSCCPGGQPCPVAPPAAPIQRSSAPAMNMGSSPAFLESILQHESAGTSSEPGSTPHAMLMASRSGWTFMFHGVAFLNAIQQSGPRGGDKVFSTNWFMPMAQRHLGPGTLTLRAMLSLEPATITGERYPELFQVGETAYGSPIVDGQHPHNLFMELALLYDLKIGRNALLSFYGAPVGDPALGPEAFPHRASASEDPIAPLGHHLEDSTHISDDVLTMGFAYKIARVEVSGFHGREPGEFRWDIDSGALDSWSTRLTINPSPNWSGQYSIGRLASPEQLFPGEDTLRMTASLSYNRPLRNGRGNWATMLLWGRNKDLPSGEVYNGYLAESTVRFAATNYAWTRIESVDRTNLLEWGENPLPPGFDEHFLARIQAYTLGYDHDFGFIPRVATAFGGQFMWYGEPAFLDSLYGAHPVGGVIFIRFRPKSGR